MIWWQTQILTICLPCIHSKECIVCIFLDNYILIKKGMIWNKYASVIVVTVVFQLLFHFITSKVDPFPILFTIRLGGTPRHLTTAQMDVPVELVTMAVNVISTVSTLSLSPSLSLSLSLSWQYYCRPVVLCIHVLSLSSVLLKPLTAGRYWSHIF